SSSKVMLTVQLKPYMTASKNYLLKRFKSTSFTKGTELSQKVISCSPLHRTPLSSDFTFVQQEVRSALMPKRKLTFAPTPLSMTQLTTSKMPWKVCYRLK